MQKQTTGNLQNKQSKHYLLTIFNHLFFTLQVKAVFQTNSAVLSDLNCLTQVFCFIVAK